MTIANWVLWSLGIALQAILVILLLRRGMVKRVPVFTALILFYLIRAGLSARLSPGGYQELFSILSDIDSVLQFLVTIEVTIYILRNSAAGHREHWLRSAAILVAGFAIALCAAAATPQRGRLPIDRGMVVITVIATLLAVWAAIARLHDFPRRIAEGFGIYGLIGILVTVAHNYAFLHRNGSLYVTASYVGTGIYVCVVGFWVAMVARNGHQVTRRG
jgi:hypothetical protein